ncbi:MAG: DUF3347 domain-containing protein, partial [Chitinophagales bacterium]|nr:DUF3347 domain-containing protein [Chitinophagales bacterium]
MNSNFASKSILKSQLLSGKILMIAVVLLTSVIVQSSSAQTTNDPVLTDSTSGFTRVVTYYLDLKNELAKDQGDSARAEAKSLFMAIDNVAMDKLPADQHKVWMEYNEKLGYDAEHIKVTGDIDHQREHFISL